MMVADNCCHIHGTVASAMPETEAKLDVWHFSARYVAAILNTSKSPFRSAIAADISGAILKKHAEHGRGAEYWDRGEQEQHLVAVFDKWAEKGVWSAAAQKVHQEQLKHVRKGCLKRSDQDIRSDGSRIEGTHKGWNSLQRAQPSEIVMLSALGHDFVLHRNIRVASSRRQMTPFVKFTHGSHHIQLSNHIARLYNGLRKKDTRLLPLPELPDVDSGETFGLVASDNTTTFYSFTGGTIDFATEASRSIMIEDWQIDPALLDQPATQLLLPHATKVIPASPTKRKVSCVSFDANDELDSGNTSKRPRTLDCPSTGISNAITPSTGISNAITGGHPAITSDHPVISGATTEVCPITPDQRYTRKLPPEFSQDCPSAGISNAIIPSAGISNTITGGHPAVTSDHPVIPGATAEVCAITPDQRYTRKLPPKFSQDCPSAGINNTITRSQHLFFIATGIDPRSLTLQNSDEFYLFMDMRAKFKWLSYQMTLKRWVLATEEYNRRLTQTAGRSVIQKNPQALLHALGDIEPKLMNRIIRDEYTSKRNNETFWRHHCSVVPLVKQERGKKPRKVQTCSRCQTIMYPGPENSPLNHKRGYCADGVKQVSKNSGEDLPPWPQPQGLFSEGHTFHLHAFLLAVQRVYEYVSLQGPGEMDLLETEAFAKLLVSRTEIHEDGAVLFRLFTDFIVDPSTPCDRIVVHDDKQWLRINFLQQP
ncbi:uncharacterized protein F5147DRAFT_643230 [Suillus discolor]|uniref:Uncharacterized protein n=1 Tax=Suillus discolor TaxID=1912936 RepID=A0A9P7JMQ5_9AGAM|nr:uncharacterized protein F5147DRAFT_643230 [Suillus discolor]KAG2091336.1 hypothetical protein F5147DRAFT_643230 [Suillus discolor]